MSDTAQSVTESSRGEKQQVHWLARAMKKIDTAIQEHEAGMTDPALADADTAAAYLENYRKGPPIPKAVQEHREGDDA